jgi:hypothetical protein
MEPPSDRNAGLTDILREALQLADETIQDALGSEDPACLAVLHHVTLLSRDAAAVSLLCREGFSDSALLQLRRIWETSLRLQYIRMKPAPRGQEFLEHGWVREKQALRKVAQSPSSILQDPYGEAIRQDPRLAEKVQELETAAESVSEGARAKADGPRDIRKLWPIGSMANDLGRRNEYDYIYDFLSERSHGGPDVAKDLFTEDASGNISVNIRDYAELCLGQAASWLLYGLDALAQLVAPDRCQDATRLFAQLEREVNIQVPQVAQEV